MSDTSKDAWARRRAQEEFARPIVLEAGAGTGKTAVLTARLLAWTLGPGWERARARHPGASGEEVAVATVRGVLALTFTEAAAAEMEERVAGTLAAVAGGAPPLWLLLPPHLGRGEMIGRAVHLGLALDHLRVSTIHSYCLALLREESLAGGVHPGFAVDPDQTMLEEIISAELSAWLPEAAASPAMRRLAAGGGNLNAVREALAYLVAAGVEAGELRVAGPATRCWDELEQLQAALAALAEVGRGREDLSRRSPTSFSTWSAVERSLAVLRVGGGGEGAAAAEVLKALWPNSLRQRLGGWGKGGWNASERAALAGRVDEATTWARQASGLLESILASPAGELEAAAEVLTVLLERVRERLRVKGVITFEELLRGAERLLCTHPEVAARERSRLDQVLVDEFQDTDQVQCNIIKNLCLEGPAEQRPGLFVVGDPKQSIYAWRSADLAAYEGFVRQVTEAGGEVHSLCVNFRSVPAILAEVEQVIAPAMAYEPGVQPAFQPLLSSEARRNDSGFRRGRWVPVEYWEVPEGEGVPPSVLVARAVAADVAALGAEKVRWERIAILLRTTGELETYLKALRAAGVPYLAARERSYYQRREVIEAVALLRVLADPTDQVALLGWLRSPMVGVPDAALLPLWRAGLPQLLTELRDPEDPRLEKVANAAAEVAAAVPAGVPGIERVRGWETLLVEAGQLLAELRWWLEREPFPMWLERVRQVTWLEAGEAVRYLGRFRLANLDSLFQRLERQVEEAGGDRRAVLTAVRRALADEQGRDHRKAAGGGIGGVQVMTIHAAKGLDFDHVYLVEIHRRSRRVEGENQVVRVGQQVFLKLLGYPWPGFQKGAVLRRRVEEAELVRTLYVALTRAKERLVVTGDWGVEGRDGFDSHLDILRNRRPGLVWDRAEEENGWSWVDVDGARWVRPPVLGSEGEVKRPGVSGLAVDVGALAAEAERLGKLKEGAARRAGRARGGAVTAEAHRGEEDWLAGDHRPRGVAVVAAAAGTAVHRVMQELDLRAPVAEEVRRLLGELEAFLPGELSAEQRTAAAMRARGVLERFVRSSLARRFEEVAPAVLGREVPLLLAGDENGAGPLGYLSGAMDLLYRDAATTELVVVDFKTDALAGEDEVVRAAEGYRRQGELYCRAVQEAFALPRRPQFELWFLQQDRIVRLG